MFDPDQPHPETIADFALMEARPDAVFVYWRLAVETSAYGKSLKQAGLMEGGMTWFEVDCAEYACHRLEPFADRAEAAALIERWSAWGEEYEDIYERSPKWRLKEMIGEVSESHCCISWPKRWERAVWEWVLSPVESGPLPFDDRKGIMDSDFKQRLKSLVQACDGFLYRCEETGQIVFAPTSVLPRIWKHQDHLAQIDREKPFGFFHDASRPDYRNYARPLTEAEERTMRAMGPKDSPGPAQRIWRRMRAWLSL